MRDILEDIINKNKVDLVLAGHVHAYERLFPIFKNKIDYESLRNNDNTYFNPKYAVHLVCGAGGNKEGYENCKILFQKKINFYLFK
jgi:acid phosphatase